MAQRQCRDSSATGARTNGHGAKPGRVSARTSSSHSEFFFFERKHEAVGPQWRIGGTKEGDVDLGPTTKKARAASPPGPVLGRRRQKSRRKLHRKITKNGPGSCVR